MTDRARAVAVVRGLLDLRASVQAAHDAHLFEHLDAAEPGSPMEQRDGNLRGMLRCLDEALAATRLVVETCDVMARHQPALEAWQARREVPR